MKLRENDGMRRKKKMPIPEIGKCYNCFDDGKIKESRLYKTTVVQIIPFNDIDAPTLAVWKNSVEQYSWLFNKTNDYFIMCSGDENGPEIFVRTIHNEWYSLESPNKVLSGVLDVDGTLTNRMDKPDFIEWVIGIANAWEKKNGI